MISYCTIWYHIVQYDTILYNMIPYCTIIWLSAGRPGSRCSGGGPHKALSKLRANINRAYLYGYDNIILYYWSRIDPGLILDRAWIIILYNRISHCTIWYHNVQYDIILYNMASYCTIWYHLSSSIGRKTQGSGQCIGWRGMTLSAQVAVWVLESARGDALGR